jgi:hypothetical protein
MIFASSSLAGSADLVDVFLRLRGNGQIPTVPLEPKRLLRAARSSVRQTETPR